MYKLIVQLRWLLSLCLASLKFRYQFDDELQILIHFDIMIERVSRRLAKVERARIKMVQVLFDCNEHLVVEHANFQVSS